MLFNLGYFLHINQILNKNISRMILYYLLLQSTRCLATDKKTVYYNSNGDRETDSE